MKQRKYETNQELYEKMNRAKFLLEEAAHNLEDCSMITCHDDYIGPLLTTRMVLREVKKIKLSSHLIPGQSVVRG